MSALRYARSVFSNYDTIIDRYIIPIIKKNYFWNGFDFFSNSNSLIDVKQI